MLRHTNVTRIGTRVRLVRINTPLQVMCHVVACCLDLCVIAIPMLRFVKIIMIHLHITRKRKIVVTFTGCLFWVLHQTKFISYKMCVVRQWELYRMPFRSYTIPLSMAFCPCYLHAIKTIIKILIMIFSFLAFIITYFTLWTNLVHT